MLALPEVTAPAGIVPTAVSLGATWVLLTLDALLIAEVNLAARAARDANRAAKGNADSSGCDGGAAAGSGIITLRQMAEFSLGKAGKSERLLPLLCCFPAPPSGACCVAEACHGRAQQKHSVWPALRV